MPRPLLLPPPLWGRTSSDSPWCFLLCLGRGGVLPGELCLFVLFSV